MYYNNTYRYNSDIAYCLTCRGIPSHFICSNSWKIVFEELMSIARLTTLNINEVEQGVRDNGFILTRGIFLGITNKDNIRPIYEVVINIRVEEYYIIIKRLFVDSIRLFSYIQNCVKKMTTEKELNEIIDVLNESGNYELETDNRVIKIAINESTV